jgi:hypothetical protein
MPRWPTPQPLLASSAWSRELARVIAQLAASRL